MRLTELMPSFWERSPVVMGIQRGMEPALEAAWAARDDLLEQLNVSTSTWGLALWERSLGLQVDVGKELEFRRTRVISKLRGSGATTVASLKNVAESFSNGAVEVIEYPGEHRFDVVFVSHIGIPPNMADLTAAIEECKPAHLSYRYIYRYCAWEMLLEKVWQELEPFTWNQVYNGDPLR